MDFESTVPTDLVHFVLGHEAAYHLCNTLSNRLRDNCDHWSFFVQATRKIDSAKVAFKRSSLKFSVDGGMLNEDMAIASAQRDVDFLHMLKDSPKVIKLLDHQVRAFRGTLSLHEWSPRTSFSAWKTVSNSAFSPEIVAFSIDPQTA